MSLFMMLRLRRVNYWSLRSAGPPAPLAIPYPITAIQTEQRQFHSETQSELNVVSERRLRRLGPDMCGVRARMWPNVCTNVQGTHIAIHSQWPYKWLLFVCKIDLIKFRFEREHNNFSLRSDRMPLSLRSAHCSAPLQRIPLLFGQRPFIPAI